MLSPEVYSSEFMELREVNLTIDSQGFTHPDGRGGWPMVAGVSWRRQMEWEKTVVQLLCSLAAIQLHLRFGCEYFKWVGFF